MIRRLAACALLAGVVLFGAGCCPLRKYKFATHDPHDPSAGDVTHASEPGARVVIPKKGKP